MRQISRVSPDLTVQMWRADLSLVAEEPSLKDQRNNHGLSHVEHYLMPTRQAWHQATLGATRGLEKIERGPCPGMDAKRLKTKSD